MLLNEKKCKKGQVFVKDQRLIDFSLCMNQELSREIYKCQTTRKCLGKPVNIAGLLGKLTEWCQNYITNSVTRLATRPALKAKKVIN